MTTSNMDAISDPATRTERPRAWWMVAIVAGGLLGPLDLAGQVNAPYPVAHLLNSPAVWTAAVVWLAAGVLAGVVFGTAGWWATERFSWRAVLGRAALPAVFGAEAVHNGVRVATDPADGRPDDLEQFALLLLALAVIASTVAVRRLPRAVAVRVVSLAVGAALVIGGAVGQSI